MGLFSKVTPVTAAETKVRSAEERVKQAQRYLELMRERKASSKKVGNYKGTGYCRGTKTGGVEDANIWAAEDSLKMAKEQLASAKKKLTEAKRRDG